MGRKVHPIGFRLGYNKTWSARWYAEGTRYTDLLHEDLGIRRLIDRDLKRAAVSRVEIERFPKQIRITIHSAKPGKKVRLEVTEVQRPELDAVLVAQSIAEQLERRIHHKRAMKQAVGRAMRAGAQGIRIQCSGRLSGAEMARREWVREGRVPLHTLRADIDFAISEGLTQRGRIGVKVWIYRGELLPKGAAEEESASSAAV